MAGLVRTPKPSPKDEDKNSKKKTEPLVIKKVQKKKVEEEEEEEVDDKKLLKKKVIAPPATIEAMKKESIGITGTGNIANEFRRICKESGINMSFELCKMISAFNKVKGGGEK